QAARHGVDRGDRLRGGGYRIARRGRTPPAARLADLHRAPDAGRGSGEARGLLGDGAEGIRTPVFGLDAKASTGLAGALVSPSGSAPAGESGRPVPRDVPWRRGRTASG